MAIEAVSDIRRAGTSAFATGGGGGASSVVVTIAPAAMYQAESTASVPLSTVNSKVLCQLAPNADWDADDLADLEVIATPLAGSIIFTITRPGPIVGEFLILYTLG